MNQNPNKNLNKEIKYIGFYDQPGSLFKRASALSAINKMDYICDALQRAGYNVHLISPSWFIEDDAKWTRQSTMNLNGYKKLTLSPSYGTSNRWTLYLKIVFSLVWLFLFLLFNTKKNETILVYNATWLSLPVRIAKVIKGYHVVLEVEEINGEVWRMKDFLREQEKKFISCARSFIVASDIIADKFLNKSTVILYGAYNAYIYNYISIQRVVKITDKTINIVFAGAIENTRCGAYIAVECARHLPKDYVVHILGYGSKDDITQLNSQIADMNLYLGRRACLFHGTLTGTQFSNFLRGCDIAINSQREGSYMESAFPSKILTYLAHNLRVVSTRINSIRKSRLSSLLYFAEDDTPEAISHAIKTVNLKSEYDCRPLIKQLDEAFVKDIKLLLENG